MKLPADIVLALVYYGDYQSYLDPLGKPCQCVTCDKGARAREALAQLDQLVVPPIEHPSDAREMEDTIILVRATLAFYASGAATQAMHAEYGHLARHCLKCLYATADEIERYHIASLYVDYEMVEAAASTMPWSRADAVLD